MKAICKTPPAAAPHVFMRAAGYARTVDRDGVESFVRRVSGGDFPRFHAYVQIGTRVTISLHIDQKAHTYTGVSAHSGEYVSDAIAHELARVSAAIGCPMTIAVDRRGKPLSR